MLAEVLAENRLRNRFSDINISIKKKIVNHRFFKC